MLLVSTEPPWNVSETIFFNNSSPGQQTHAAKERNALPQPVNSDSLADASAAAAASTAAARQVACSQQLDRQRDGG